MAHGAPSPRTWSSGPGCSGLSDLPPVGRFGGGEQDAAALVLTLPFSYWVMLGKPATVSELPFTSLCGEGSLVQEALIEYLL